MFHSFITSDTENDTKRDTDDDSKSVTDGADTTPTDDKDDNEECTINESDGAHALPQEMQCFVPLTELPVQRLMQLCYAASLSSNVASPSNTLASTTLDPVSVQEGDLYWWLGKKGIEAPGRVTSSTPSSCLLT